MIGKGTLLRTRTRTLNDVFGEVVWEVAQTGMPAPEKERKGEMDGVKCVMLCGTGKAARPGYVVYDSVHQIEADMAAGTTAVVPPEQKDEVLRTLGGKDGERGCGRTEQGV